MYSNPIKAIFLLSFKLIFKYLPFTKNLLKISSYNAFISIFTSLFSCSALLYKTLGFLPTFRVLLAIRNVINRIALPLNRSNRTNININDLPAHLPGLNRYILDSFINILTPHWSDCVVYPKLFKNLFDIFIFLNFFGLFSFSFRIINYIFRFSIGTLLSTIGIL
jgi:hypothetical protein